MPDLNLSINDFLKLIEGNVGQFGSLNLENFDFDTSFLNGWDLGSTITL